MTFDYATTGRWSKGPGGVWLVDADHALLQTCFERGLEVPVKRRGGAIEDVALEHVTAPLSNGRAYGWPVGTKADKTRKHQLARHRLPERRPAVGSKRSGERQKTNRARRRRR